MLTKPAILVLADGTIMEGYSVGASGQAVGELVFNTSMTGYQEMLTDPSYMRQIITLTASHIGNTGCNADDMESSRIWASGLVMRECTQVPSNYRAKYSLPEWLQKNNVVAIAGLDTRQLTRHIQKHGAMNACITTDIANPEKALLAAREFPSLVGADLAKEVSCQAIDRWHHGRGEWGHPSEPQALHVVAYDFGVKHSILRILHEKGCYITMVPAKTPAQEVFDLQPDGIFLSNGPGDPFACDYAIEAIKQFLKKDIPLFGICLGFQLLCLAAGAKSLKMKFGHHGANHPVVDITRNNRVFITSQNHGFAIDEKSLPKTLEVTHRSLFDQSLQGIRHKQKPVIGFQGHPEASPGPHDIELIFDEFIDMMRTNNQQKEMA